MFEQAIGTDFLIPFVRENLLSLLIVLLGINLPALGIILTKMRDIIDDTKNPGAFEGAKKAAILIIYEQLGLIVVAVVLLMLLQSRVASEHEVVLRVSQKGLIACLVYGLAILHNIACSQFAILAGADQQKPKS